MTDPTYGELVNRAGVSLARAMTTPTENGRAEDVMVLARGLDVLRHAICRHAEFASDPWRSRSRRNRQDDPVVALAAALRPSWLPIDGAQDLLGQPASWWAQATAYLGAASDLLATHVGPDGRHLTNDARRFVDADGRRQLVRDAARFADTVAEYALHCARRVATEPHNEYVRDVVARWFEHGGHVRSTAYRILHATDAVAEHDLLGGLTPAPILCCEPVTNTADAFRAFNRLRRLCHAQAIGDSRADAATLRGFAALGYTITGHAHVVHRAVAARAPDLGLDQAVCEQHRLAADRCKKANAAWGDLHAALANVRDAGGGPAGWHADVLGVREQLACLIRRDQRLLPPDELVPDLATSRSHLAVVGRFVADLPSIAAGQRESARSLYRGGQLHVPTRQLEGADIPRLYAPIPGHRFDDLLVAYAAAETATRDARDASSRADQPRCDSSRTTPRSAALRHNERFARATEAPAMAR